MGALPGMSLAAGGPRAMRTPVPRAHAAEL